MRDVNLMIGVPSQANWSAKNSASFALMLVHLAFPQKNYKHQFYFWNERGSILPQLRQNLVDKALSGGATHLLMIDSDQTFPEYLPTEWLEADYPVIAANVATKSVPTWPTARREGNGLAGVPVYSDVAKERFEKIWRVGTGIMMLSREVLEAIPRPAFTPYWHKELDKYVYEDWVLCEHIERAGFPIRVDNKLSLQVGHVGEFEFTHDHVAMSRRANAQAQSEKEAA